MSGFQRIAVKRDFSRAAHAYDAAAMLQHAVRAECVERLTRLLRVDADLHLLDAGCGTGALSTQLTPLAPRWQVTGLDIAPAMCAVASRLCPAINADIALMPFAGAQFDAVVSSLALQWVNEPLKALTELARVVKPGGHAVITSFGPRTLTELKQSFAEVDDQPHVSTFRARGEMVALMQRAGWQVMDASETLRPSTHPNLAHLTEQLKSIGATNKHALRRRGLTTQRTLDAVEAVYARRFSEAGQLTCTWETQLFVLRRD